MSRARDLADGTFSGSFSADSPTLVVDDANNRVGVGTASPGRILDVTQSGDAVMGIATTGTGPTDNAGVRIASPNKGYLIQTGETAVGSGLRFYDLTAGAERLRIQSGGGISFNGDTAAANALDDYEEGTWTPTPDTGSLSSVTAKYIKIGKLVTVVCDFIVSSGGANYIYGLPFAVDVTTGITPYQSAQDIPTGRTYITFAVASSQIYVRGSGDNIAFTNAPLTTGAYFHFSITYITT